MGTSDWGDWLPRAVADAEPDGLSLWYLGCNGVIVKAADGTTIVVDPYVGTGDPPRTIRMVPVPFDPHDIDDMDAVLVTHEHTDHLHGPTQGPMLERTGASLLAHPRTIEILGEQGWHDQWAFQDEQLDPIAVEESREIGSLTVTAGPANDPNAEGAISYIIEHDAGTLFHGGDSLPTEAFGEVGAAIDIDLAMLAFGSVGNVLDREHTQRTRTKWYADENEVIKMAYDLRADRLMPSHWDMWKGLTADPSVLHDHLRGWSYPRRLEIVEIGDRIDV